VIALAVFDLQAILLGFWFKFPLSLFVLYIVQIIGVICISVLSLILAISGYPLDALPLWLLIVVYVTSHFVIHR
jgi:hypothetical protein